MHGFMEGLEACVIGTQMLTPHGQPALVSDLRPLAAARAAPPCTRTHLEVSNERPEARHPMADEKEQDGELDERDHRIRQVHPQLPESISALERGDLGHLDEPQQPHDALELEPGEHAVAGEHERDDVERQHGDDVKDEPTFHVVLDNQSVLVHPARLRRRLFEGLYMRGLESRATVFESGQLLTCLGVSRWGFTFGRSKVSGA